MASLSVSRRLELPVDIEFQTDILAWQNPLPEMCSRIHHHPQAYLNADGILTRDDACG